MGRVRWLAVAAGLGVVGAFGVASAQGAVVTGREDLPENAELAPGLDLRQVAVTYNPQAGTVVGTALLRGEPVAADNGTLLIVLGREHEGQCSTRVEPAGTVQSPLHPEVGGERVARVGDGTPFAEGVSIRANGSTITLRAQSAALVGKGWNCASLATGVMGAGVRDQPPNPLPLRPADSGAPTPARPGTPSPAAKRARLVVSAPAAARLVPGAWQVVRVTVANRGTAAAVRPRVTLALPRGVAARLGSGRATRVRTLPTLAPGRSATVSVRLRAATRPSARGVAVVRVNAGAVRATARVSLSARAVRRPAPAPRPATPASPASALVGTYHWGFKRNSSYRGWDNRAVHFQDGRWAYWGFPATALPTRCTAVTNEVDEDGDPTGQGCRRYTLNAATGTLKVGDMTGTYKDGTVTLDDIPMSRLHIPAAGSTLDVQLTHRNFIGMCGMVTGCTTWHETLLLSADGKFVRTESSMSSLGGIGTPYVWSGQFPPDATGTYRILPGARLRLSFNDGSVKEYPIGVELNKAGRPDAKNEGVVVGDVNFYPERD